MQYDKDAFYQRIFASEGGQGQISLTFIVATGFEHGNLGQWLQMLACVGSRERGTCQSCT